MIKTFIPKKGIEKKFMNKCLMRSDFEDVGGIGAGVVVAGANGVVLFSPQVALGGSP